LRTGKQKRQDVTRRLIVLFGRRRRDEMIRTRIRTHEEGVRSGKIASDDATSLARAEANQGLEPRAEEIRPVGCATRLIRHPSPTSEDAVRLGRDDCPYPSVRLFRQREGDWPAVFGQIAAIRAQAGQSASG
jgi:1,6-anhydro-N-acetylmuramate kinase